MSIIAAVFWVAVHLLFGAAFASSVTTASTAGNKGKLASALLGVIAVAGVAGYSAFALGSGVLPLLVFKSGKLRQLSGCHHAELL